MSEVSRGSPSPCAYRSDHHTWALNMCHFVCQLQSIHLKKETKRSTGKTLGVGGKDSPTPAPALLWLCPWPPWRGPWALSQEAEWWQLTHTVWTCVGLSRVIFMTRKQGGNLDPRTNKTLDSVCIYCFRSCRSACTLKRQARTPLVGQWLRLHAPSEGGMGSTPGQGTRSTYCNKDRGARLPQLRPSTVK